MNALNLIKRGARPALDLPTILKALGIEMDFSELPGEQWPDAFQDVARSTLRSGASVVRLRGKMQDGSQMDAIMVTSSVQVTGAVTIDSEKKLDILPVSL